MKSAAILATRLIRQRLSHTASTESGYRQLFASLQPVSPVYFSCPGDPPSLVHRSALDDRAISAGWRETREIVKGRFLKGTIGYVLSEELELYANAFMRPLEKFDHNQELIYDTLAHTGPLTPRQIKEETGLLNKVIMPALHRLQEAFLVYEDQVDGDWERAWYIFSSEWPDVVLGPECRDAAAYEVLRRLIYANVFVSAEQIKDWSGWSVKETKHLLEWMQASGTIVPCAVDGLGEGWVCAQDAAIDAQTPTPSVLMLHKADPLVRTNISELKRRYAGLEVLQYLLIDGDFRGAVCGHWRIGPHDVEDIVVELPAQECKAREAEIIDAVAFVYHPPSHGILRYNGQHINTM